MNKCFITSGPGFFFLFQDHEDVALLILDKLEDTNVINQANVDLKM